MPPVATPPSDCNCSEVQAELETKLKDMEERLANETKLHAAELANETKLRAAELKAMEERTEAALEAIRQFILMTPPSPTPLCRRQALCRPRRLSAYYNLLTRPVA